MTLVAVYIGILIGGSAAGVVGALMELAGGLIIRRVVIVSTDFDVHCTVPYLHLRVEKPGSQHNVADAVAVAKSIPYPLQYYCRRTKTYDLSIPIRTTFEVVVQGLLRCAQFKLE